MPVVVLAATKGGVGKTTLAATLAVEASRKSQRIAVIDLDPQQSLARWHELRVSEIGDGSRPALIEVGRYPDQTLAKTAAGDWDWVIVDCPPGSIRCTGLGVAAADLVIIPVRPSPLDVEAIDVMVELCQQHERPFAFVLSQTAPRSSMTTGARQYLASKGEVLSVEIGNRQSYAAGMILGGTATEKDAAARSEIAALWEIIAKLGKLSTKNKVASKKRVSS